MRRSKWFLVVALLALVSLLGAACGQDEEEPAGGGAQAEKQEVAVYFQGALTGEVSYLVIPGFQGAQLRFQELNEDPNFPARVSLKRADTQGDPKNAPPVVQEVVSDPDTVAVVGPAFSGESAASGDTYNESKIPFITPAATAVALAEENWDYWYRAIGNDGAQGSLGAQYLAEQVNARRLFIAHDKSEYGQGLAESVRDSIRKAGGVQIVGFEGVEPTEDYSALISSVEASKADAFYYGGYDAQFGKIVKQARDAGLNDLEIMSGDGSLSTTTLDLAGRSAEGVHISAPTNLGGDFIRKYNREYGGRASAVPIYATEGYDVAGLVGEGIRSAIDAGANDPQAIREGIKEYLDGLSTSNPFEGAAKEYFFDPQTHELGAGNPAELFYFYRVRNGVMSPLGTGIDLGLSVQQQQT